ncbi:MAG: AbrB/MazE/SpoVT family DNA-binding domain-containing protein [Euryarchaeota archaeon]|nr:AbrB/MazE/SpoVT family DNA-binding domain-containing protein [Euryarchaeota archaeon]
MAEGKISKKFALYPPKSMLGALGLKEGEKVRYKIEKGKLIIEPIQDPLSLALKIRKWNKTSVKELERVRRDAK